MSSLPPTNSYCYSNNHSDSDPFFFYDLVNDPITLESVNKIPSSPPLDPNIRASIEEWAHDNYLILSLISKSPLPDWIPQPDTISDEERKETILHLCSKYPEILFNQLVSNLTPDFIPDLKSTEIGLMSLNMKDDEARTALHHACLWNHPKKYDLILLIYTIYPDLLEIRDNYGDLPFDLIGDNTRRPTSSSSDVHLIDQEPTFIDFLLINSHPKTPLHEQFPKAQHYRWLSLLCTLKNCSLAIEYANRRPHSLFSIAFDDLETIKEKGRFNLISVGEFPMSVAMNRLDSNKEVLKNEFLKIWNNQMAGPTGIPISLFEFFVGVRPFTCGIPFDDSSVFLSNRDMIPLARSFFPSDLPIFMHLKDTKMCFIEMVKIYRVLEKCGFTDEDITDINCRIRNCLFPDPPNVKSSKDWTVYLTKIVKTAWETKNEAAISYYSKRWNQMINFYFEKLIEEFTKYDSFDNYHDLRLLTEYISDDPTKKKFAEIFENLILRKNLNPIVFTKIKRDYLIFIRRNKNVVFNKICVSSITLTDFLNNHAGPLGAIKEGNIDTEIPRCIEIANSCDKNLSQFKNNDWITRLLNDDKFDLSLKIEYLRPLLENIPEMKLFLEETFSLPVNLSREQILQFIVFALPYVADKRKFLIQNQLLSLCDQSINRIILDIGISELSMELPPQKWIQQACYLSESWFNIVNAWIDCGGVLKSISKFKNQNLWGTRQPESLDLEKCISLSNRSAEFQLFLKDFYLNCLLNDATVQKNRKKYLDFVLRAGIKLSDNDIFSALIPASSKEAIKSFKYVGYILENTNQNFKKASPNFTKYVTRATKKAFGKTEKIQFRGDFNIALTEKENLIQISINSAGGTPYVVRGYFTTIGLNSFLDKMVEAIEIKQRIPLSPDNPLAYLTDGSVQRIDDEISERINEKLPIRFYFSQGVLHRRHFNFRQSVFESKLVHSGHQILNLPTKGPVVFGLKSIIESEQQNYVDEFQNELTKLKKIRNNHEKFKQHTKIEQFLIKLNTKELYIRLNSMLSNQVKLSTMVRCIPTNRSFWGWHDSTINQAHVVPLPIDLEQQSKMVKVLTQIKEHTIGCKLSVERLTPYIITTPEFTQHDQPANVSIQDVLNDFSKLELEGKFNDYLKVNHQTARGFKENFTLMVTSIFEKKNIRGLDPIANAGEYQKLKIQFSQTYVHLKTFNYDGLKDLFQDISKHTGYCSYGVKKEIWQHYAIAFQPAETHSEGKFLQEAISSSINVLIDSLQSFVVHGNAVTQTLHARNFIKLHLSKVLPAMPYDPFTSYEGAVVNDSYATASEIPDYDGPTIGMIGNNSLFPLIVFQILEDWNYMIRSKQWEKCSIASNEFFESFMNSTSLPLSVRLEIDKSNDRIANELVNLRDEVTNLKQQLAVSIETNQIYRRYAEVKSAFQKEKQENQVLRSKRPIGFSDDEPSSKRQRGIGAGQTTSLDWISKKLTRNEELIETMEKHPEIVKINSWEKKIRELDEKIESKIKGKNGYSVAICASYLNKKNIKCVKKDKILKIYTPTVKGIILWLEMKNIVDRIFIPEQQIPPELPTIVDDPIMIDLTNEDYEAASSSVAGPYVPHFDLDGNEMIFPESDMQYIDLDDDKLDWLFG